MKKYLVYVWLGIAALVAVALPASAQPLGTAFTYQGQLKNSGSPATGSFNMVFTLWNDLTLSAPANQVGPTLTFDGVGGNPLPVAVASGLFTVQLDFGGTAYNGNKRWLEIAVSGTTLVPRQELTAAPNALFTLNAATATTATNATQLNGQAASFYQNASNLSSGTIPDARLAGTYSGALALSNAGNTFSGSGAGLTGLNAGSISQGLLSSAFGGTGLNTSAASTGSLLYTSGVGAWSVLPPGSNTQVLTLSSGVPVWAASGGGLSLPYAGTANVAFGGAAFKVTNTGLGYSLWGQNSASSGAGVFGDATASGGAGVGVYGQSAGTYGVYGSATAASGVTFGGSFQCASTDGSGVYGSANASSGATNGGRFESGSTSGKGVYGLASAGSGTNYGVYGVSNSTSGYGVYGTGSGVGVYGTSTGTGVSGYASAANGGTAGGLFQSDSTSGIGVFGYAFALSGTTYGGYFSNNSPSGRAVYGVASVASGDARGVYGVSNSTSGLGTVGYATAGIGTTYGVYGQADSASGYGLWASGRTGASGTKSFRIDHPDDPANKYLLHYCVESPEVLNAYSGKVILDGAGQAVVELPHYFAKINKDPRYTLTALGAPMPMLHVAEEIEESALSAGAKAGPGEAAQACSFRIAGGAPGAKVSWEVKALRNDQWVQQRGAPVEVEKQGREKGTYQHPDFYGQPPEKGLNYDAARGRPSPPAVPDARRR